MKLWMGIALGFVFFAVLVFAGLYTFTRSIYKSRSCTWANIDNIEMHSAVDIPAINDCNCSFIREDRTKKVVFSLDRNNVNIDTYIQRQQFQKLTAQDASFASGFETLDPSLAEPGAEIYFRHTTNNGDNARFLLQKNTGKLYVILQYAV